MGIQTDSDRSGQVVLRLAVGLAVLTALMWAAPVRPATGWLLKDLLLLAAFGLPLYPLYAASQAARGSESFAWSLLLFGCISGLAGQAAGIFYRLAVGPPDGFVLPEVGFAGWIVLTAGALAIEVSSGGRGVRAELVVDLLLIGGIGLVLAREIFAFVGARALGLGAFELLLGGANVIASLALAVAALGVLMSPSALGGGVPRLLITLGGFAVAVSRMIFAYRLFRGATTPWLTPAWSLALVLIAVAGAVRLGGSGADAPVAGRTSLLRTLVVPVIVAYAMSLLIRELLGTGESGGPDGIAWAMLALLIVTRVGVAIFVSEKQSQEISAWERRYETVVNALGEVVYEWDVDDDRVLRSGSIEQVFGVDGDELDDDPAATLERVHPDDREAVERQRREAVERGGWFEMEYRFRHADGDWRLIRDRGFCEPGVDGRSTRVLGLMADITEERRAEERLIRAERLAALGGLAAGAAHEINNPLAAIHLASQMLQEDARLPAEVQEDVRIIARQAQRAGEVTDRMLVFARKKEGERAAVDLETLIEDLLRSRRYDLETHGIRLEEEYATDVPPVWVDPGQVERALLNLVINAERALTEVPEGERTLRVRTSAAGRGARVQIIDNGPGIPPEVLPRIFDPFFTTREVGEGTGLGLSMSYGVVHDHGGELSVETRPGRTVFTLELPPLEEGKALLERARKADDDGGAVDGDGGAADDDGRAADDDAGSVDDDTGAVDDAVGVLDAVGPSGDGAGPGETRDEAGAPAGRAPAFLPRQRLDPDGRDGRPRNVDSLSVLVVDDEASVRRLARRFLEQQGHRVDEAASGRAALEYLTDRQYDSVILDLRMPDLSGEGLYEWMKKNRPALAERVTVISGDFANPETSEIIERMGRPYLLKPFDLQELLALVEG